jgi:hypothetical protein
MPENMISKKLLRFVLSVGVIVLLCMGTIQYMRLLYEFDWANVSLMVLRDLAVLDVEILSDNGGFFSREFFIKVLFNDGGNLMLRNVNERGKGRVGGSGRGRRGGIEIRCVDDYVASITNVDRPYDIPYYDLHMEMWSALIGEQLESITDIVKNYPAISQHVKNWPNLYDYQIDDTENLGAVRDRLVAENIFPNSIITFKGQKYSLFKNRLGGEGVKDWHGKRRGAWR